MLTDWAVSLEAAAGDEGSNQNLRFGTAQNATDGFDSGLDVPHPPPGPGSTFVAYFSCTSTMFPQLDKDYQAPLAEATDVLQWQMTVKSSTTDITLSWNVSQIPAELEILIQTEATSVHMKTQNSLVVPAGEHTMVISAYAA